MIVDSSAIVSVLFQEDHGPPIRHILAGPDRKLMGAPNWLETVIVISRLTSGIRALDDLLSEANVEVVPFTSAHTSAAASAFLEYGKGRGSRASLNYGDCMAYAIAKTTGRPLLCKGDDFVHTDLELVDY